MTRNSFAADLELRNNRQQLLRIIHDLQARLAFVLARTPTEDGFYTFPDGETWPASSELGDPEDDRNPEGGLG